jgi:BlaI family transcriptional regulator, penicillinase repressor
MVSTRKPLVEASDSEWEILKVLWEHGPLAMGEIHARLAGRQPWAYSTVKTLLRRLVDKGWIDYQRVGSSHLYRVAVPRKAAIRMAIRQFADRVLGGALTPFLVHYAEETRLTPEELADIENILRSQRRRARRKDRQPPMTEA